MTDETTFQQIIWNIEHIGTQPAVALKILQKSQEPDVDIGKLAEIIGQDPTIGAQILKTANSVFFSRAERIKTIKAAVIHMGMANVKSTIFAIAVLGVFKNNCSSERFPEVDFWKHSIAGGLIAAKFAQTAFCDIDTFYIAALLRNIGILAVRQFMPGDFEEMLTDISMNSIGYEEACRRRFGVSHRAIAYMVGLKWNLPRTLIESINDRRNPYEESRETSEIKLAIDSADLILQKHVYAQWDTFAQPPFLDVEEKLVQSLFAGVEERTNLLYEELWT